MKKLTLILCVVIAMAFTGMVFAQTASPPQKHTTAQPAQATKPAEKPTPPQPANPAPKQPVAKPAVAKPVGEKKVMERHMVGVMVSVDAVANTFVVKGKKGDVTFQAEPTAKIMIAGKEAKLADTKKDSKVTVTYRWEGKKRVATAIKCA